MGKKIIVLVIAVLIVGGAAYGLTRNKNNDTNSDNGTGSNTSQNTTPNPSPSSNNSTSSTNNSSSSSGSSQSTNAVSINNFAFSPKDITVKKGTTVTWTNNDSVTHTVQETDGKSGPKSDNLANGATYTYTFIAAGTFAYHCSIHPDMTGTVTVTE